MAQEELVVHAVSSDITLKYIGRLEQNKRPKRDALQILPSISMYILTTYFFVFVYNNLRSSLRKIFFTLNEEIALYKMQIIWYKIFLYRFSYQMIDFRASLVFLGHPMSMARGAGEWRKGKRKGRRDDGQTIVRGWSGWSKLTVTTSIRSLGKKLSFRWRQPISRRKRISGTQKNFQSNRNPRNAFALVFA